jgi:hypothetical protein
MENVWVSFDSPTITEIVLKRSSLSPRTVQSDQKENKSEQQPMEINVQCMGVVSNATL